MHPEQYQKVEQVRQATGVRIGLKEWESITKVVVTDDLVMLKIETYQVQVLVREDRYNKKGTRLLTIQRGQSGWYVEDDMTLWDETFVPYVYEKVGRRQTADELQEQREWEKLCYRPGNGRFPLDSYDRVLDPQIRSTEKMERHF